MVHVQVEGRAQFAKAAIACPWLKYPMTNLGGTVRMADNALKANSPFNLVPCLAKSKNQR